MSERPALRVLHIGTERRWRGGENQIRLLIEGSAGRVAHAVAYPAGSPGLARFTSLAPVVPLRRAAPTSLADVLALRRFCREHDIGILDAHSGNAHTLALLVAAGLPRTAVVVHRRVASRIRPGLYNRWKYRSPRVARFVAISAYIGEALAASGVPRERIAVVHSGVPLVTAGAEARAAAGTAWRRRLGLAPECVLFGNASALTGEKGYPVLLDALARLRGIAAFPFHCLIAGDGPLRPALEQQAEAAGIAGDVTFLGHIDDVAGLLSGLDVLVMPSRREGLGTLLLDATLAGCTLAATAAGGIPEIVHDDATGLLSPPDDAATLAANLARLGADPLLRRRLHAAALDLVRRDYAVERMVAGNLDVYAAVARERGCG